MAKTDPLHTLIQPLHGWLSAAS